MSDPTAPSTDVARQAKAPVPVPLDGPLRDLDSAYRYAAALAQSGLLPQDLRNNPSNVLVTLLYGQYLGIPPVIATQVISVVNGRPQIAGKMLLAKVREAGHAPKIVDSTDQLCTFSITRGDDGTSHEETFTIQDAAKAALCSVQADGSVKARSKSGNALPWEQYTKRMLMWRAVGHCVDVICPEVKLGFAVEGEVAPVEDDKPTLAKVVAQRSGAAPDASETATSPEPAVTDPAVAEQIAAMEAAHTPGKYTQDPPCETEPAPAPADPEEAVWADVVAFENQQGTTE